MPFILDGKNVAFNQQQVRLSASFFLHAFLPSLYRKLSPKEVSQSNKEVAVKVPAPLRATQRYSKRKASVLQLVVF